MLCRMTTEPTFVVDAPLQALVRHLLPERATLHCTDLTYTYQQITLSLIATTTVSPCPSCQQSSSQVRSRYIRTLADLPWGEHQVRYRLTVRRFRCTNPACAQQIFAERLPLLTQPRSRRTSRAGDELRAVGLALGGNAGASRTTQQHLPTSASTLLRLIRATPRPTIGTPRAIGLDEWAWRRSHHYGTIITDLETHRVLDLLPDRSVETVSAWLLQHPSVGIVCRDRFGPYAEAARQGAPSAIQVADRFHLVRNLGDALIAYLQQQRIHLQTAAEDAARQQPVVPAESRETMEDRMAATNHQRRPQHWQQRQDAISQLRLQRRISVYEQVHHLHIQGECVAEIARQIGISRKTVYDYLRMDQPPECRVHQRRRRHRVLAPYEAYLRRRWEEGCHNSTRLWQEIRDQDYRGSRRTVTRFIGELRQDGQEGYALGRETSPFTRRRGPAARDVLSAMLRRERQRKELERAYLRQLCAQDTGIAQTYALTQAFLALMRERQGIGLEAWIAEVEQQGCAELRRFATGLRDDLAAVTAGLSLEWSNGVTEAHIHRLKLLKRQSYGRAGFAMLRARVLHQDRAPVHRK